MKRLIVLATLLAACSGTPKPQDMAIVETGPNASPG